MAGDAEGQRWRREKGVKRRTHAVFFSLAFWSVASEDSRRPLSTFSVVFLPQRIFVLVSVCSRHAMVRMDLICFFFFCELLPEIGFSLSGFYSPFLDAHSGVSHQNSQNSGEKKTNKKTSNLQKSFLACLRCF